MCVCARAGFLKSSPTVYLTFLRPLLRSQGFMNFVEDAGVTGELMHVRNSLLGGPHTADKSGVQKSLFGPASIMSLHSGHYTGGGKSEGAHPSAHPGRRYSAFG